MLPQDQVWGRSFRDVALWVGVPVAVVWTASRFALGDGLGDAAFSGLLSGALWFALTWKPAGPWHTPTRLSWRDRRAVVRAVRRGHDIDNPRLAPPVIEYAGLVRDMDRRFGPARPAFQWTFVGLVAAGAIGAGIAVRPVFGYLIGAATLGLAFTVVTGPRQRRRLLANLERAEEAARRHLATASDA